MAMKTTMSDHTPGSARSGLAASAKSVSRIGQGRLHAQSAPSAGQLFSSSSATSSAFPKPPADAPAAASSTQEASQVSTPPPTGHNGKIPVFNISAKPAAELVSTPSSSRWKSCAAATGPVFQVISKGSRLPANYTPPGPPAKSQATASSRTTSRLSSRSSGSAGVSLRGNRIATPSSCSAGSTSMAFGSRITPTGRLAATSSTSGSVKSCSTTPASSCKSVVRAIDFDGATLDISPVRDSSTADMFSQAAVTPSSKSTSAAVPLGAVASNSIMARDVAATDAADDTDHLSLLHSNINSSSATWLSGNNTTDEPLLLNLSTDTMAASASTAAAAALTAQSVTASSKGSALQQPAVQGAAIALTAAEALLHQLLQETSSVAEAAGLSQHTVTEALLASSSGSSNTDASATAEATGSDGSGLDSVAGDSDDGGARHRHGSQWGSTTDALMQQAAAMLAAGTASRDVKQAMLPALLLQLAGVIANHSSSAGGASSNSNSGSAKDTGKGGGSHAFAAGTPSLTITTAVPEDANLTASVRAALSAANASILLSSGIKAGPDSTTSISDTGVMMQQSGAGKGVRLCAMKAAILCLFVLWSALAVAVGILLAGFALLDENGELNAGPAASGAGNDLWL